MERTIKVLMDMLVCVDVAQKMVQQDLATNKDNILTISQLLILFGSLAAVQGAINSALVIAQHPVLAPAAETAAG
jgi:hypothetical protein